MPVLDSRSSHAVRLRWRKFLGGKELYPTNWTDPEDKRLMKLIRKHGPLDCWETIATELGTHRDSEHCKLRWRSYLSKIHKLPCKFTCEYCSALHDASYGSERFCQPRCMSLTSSTWMK